MSKPSVIDRIRAVMRAHDMASSGSCIVAMVSGGSDSTALAYALAELRDAGEIGAVRVLHVNHGLRGEASDGDASFVKELVAHLGFHCVEQRVDIPALVAGGANMEAVARRERYAAARRVLDALCEDSGVSAAAGRVFTAHTADDRVENFFMRSIVGTGPGGFRSMDYVSAVEGCCVCRPLLELGREELRDYICTREGALSDGRAFWREDATNADTDRFRAFVRHEMVPRAKERNPRLLDTLTRTMNLIAEEDDMLREAAAGLRARCVASAGDGVLVSPALCDVPLPMRRRVVSDVLSAMLSEGDRLENASVEACLACLGQSGKVTNIQGDLAVSYNKKGLLIEPMASFRARRKRA